MNSAFCLYAKSIHNCHWECVCSSTDIEWLKERGERITDESKYDCEFVSYVILDE